MINEKITEFRIGETHQSYFYFIEEKETSFSDHKPFDGNVWYIKNSGIPVCSASKTKQRAYCNSGSFCGVYCQITIESDQTNQKVCALKRDVYQQSGENCAGRFFSKERSWSNKRGKLRYHTPMIDCVSKSSLRFTVFLFLIMMQTLFPMIIHLSNQ